MRKVKIIQGYTKNFERLANTHIKNSWLPFGSIGINDSMTLWNKGDIKPSDLYYFQLFYKPNSKL